MTNGGGARFGDEVFHAAVSRRGLLPLPFQFEIVELGITDDLAAAFSQAMQPTVLDHPAIRRKGVFLKAAPPAGAAAVEQQLPTLRFFITTKLIQRRTPGSRCASENQK